MPHASHDTAPEMRTLTIDLTVYYTLLLPRGAHDSPPALLLALHGWGQTAKRFITDFDRLRDRNILVVAPQGPHQFYLDLSTRKIGFNWLTAYDKERAIADINGYLARLLAVLNEEHPYDASRIFLLGFSQGVPMAYRFAISSFTWRMRSRQQAHLAR